MIPGISNFCQLYCRPGIGGILAMNHMPVDFQSHRAFNTNISLICITLSRQVYLCLRPSCFPEPKYFKYAFILIAGEEGIS